MAWRIDEQVVRGEVDCRARGKVTGKIWFLGRKEPVVLDLDGYPGRDLAGHTLSFSNPNPKGELGEGFAALQAGAVGDMTASRKAKVPDIPMEEVAEYYRRKEPFPWHWGNTIYLEWYSELNGRVVIESAEFELEVSSEATWTMSEEDEAAQREESALAILNTLAEIPAGDDDDEAQSEAEAEADAEAARMDLLLDRVTARLEREGAENFEKVLKEERERMKRESGEPEEVVTPEMEEERRQWIEELNAAAEEAASELEAEKWKGDGERNTRDRHPLVDRGLDLSVRLFKEVADWLPDDVQAEHPLLEIVNSASSASAKLGGALSEENEWPPDKLFAGNVLVRLKKARGYLRDALSGLDSADEGGLGTPEWRSEIRHELGEMLDAVNGLIREVREVLGEGD
ncbi:hypothetical protein ACFQY0_05760 [Haloferula chungangensis]|uniref:Uncharacterized protein n=1 Tax=Haloferula chungangensis TaxID=1048331 RepID=A0ABW2L5V5_9BACT